MEQDAYISPNVLIISEPMQGHVTPMLHLAELLCHSNLNVIFVTSTYVHQSLIKYTNVEARFACYTGFRFEAIPDELPDDHPRTGRDGTAAVLKGFGSGAKVFVRKILSVGVSQLGCLMLDGSWGDMGVIHDVANEANLPVISMRCFSAYNMWVFSCIPQLIEAGEIPFKDEDMDQLAQNIPGMDAFLRYRDLPNFCRDHNESSWPYIKQIFDGEVQKTKQAHGLILNTFEDLESPILPHVRSICSRVYSIGPLHAHLRHRLDRDQQTTTSSISSLWEVDQNCSSWLDEKPDKSVVYVSFGSVTILKREQLMEIWAGLVQSNRYFLWVVRPNLIYGNDEQDLAPSTPAEILEGTKERGSIVGWCSQEEVLAHRAVGGFLTHSGWNSTLESIVAGVPMLCWPNFGDQQISSRIVSEVWRIGLDMKDTCDRNVLAKMIDELMDGKKDELERNMGKMSLLAKMSFAEGGSSYCNLDNLIQDIKAMCLK